ncbi:dTMP kinase [bacterium]|nr:dTMP kinase [bacterium]
MSDRRRNGLLVTFEGPEGSGKSTLVGGLAELLSARCGAPLLLREPGGTPVGERIREILLDPALRELRPETELLLMVASRAQLVCEAILPALSSGRIVLCDRYADASVAYQGAGRGLGEDRVGVLNDFAVGETVPDLTLLCLLPPEAGRSRTAGRALDRLEREDAAFHDRVYASYRAMVDAGDPRFQAVDATRSPEEMMEQAVSILRSLEHDLLKDL